MVKSYKSFAELRDAMKKKNSNTGKKVQRKKNDFPIYSSIELKEEEKREKEREEQRKKEIAQKINSFQEIKTQRKKQGISIEESEKTPFDTNPYTRKLDDIISKACNDLIEMGSRKASYPSDYKDDWDQACYIARYLYAYGFEYINMYRSVLDMGIYGNNLKILSLGCGTMIDAWALKEVVHNREKNRTFFYTGVDAVEWKQCYSFAMDGQVRTHFIGHPAQVYLSEIRSLDFDIILFPKSMGDIGMDEIILESFKKLNKEQFFLAVSMIKYDIPNRDDELLLNTLVKTIEKSGYIKEEEKRWIGIKDYIIKDWHREHPTGNDIVHSLTGKNPIYSRSFENYVVIKFTRSAGNDS